MSDKKQSTKQVPPPTVITLTLPTPSDGGIPLERATATLLIQRGDLAHVRQFTYIVVDDMTTAIKEAYIALAAVEADRQGAAVLVQADLGRPGGRGGRGHGGPRCSLPACGKGSP